jgi:hypothetical protein
MNQYDEDWATMDEQTLLDAMRSYENIDKSKRRIAEASKEKEKKRKADAPNNKSKGKRTMDDDVNPRSTKRYRNHDKYCGKCNNRSREREPCSYCSKQTDWKKQIPTQQIVVSSKMGNQKNPTLHPEWIESKSFSRRVLKEAGKTAPIVMND